MSLLGMISHLAQVERSWTRRVFEGQIELPRLYRTEQDPDLDFNQAVADDKVVAEGWDTWRGEVAHAGAVYTDLDLDAPVDVHGQEVEAPATSGVLTGITSSSFNITAGAANKLAFGQPPTANGHRCQRQDQPGAGGADPGPVRQPHLQHRERDDSDRDQPVSRHLVGHQDRRRRQRSRQLLRTIDRQGGQRLHVEGNLQRTHVH
jgi:Protein of unknown function (DUF664)